MSVLVKGMKMPENCRECTGTGLNIGVSVFGGICPFCEKIRTDHDMQTGRHPDCPLTIQSEERTETHACDCISRKAAIECLEHLSACDEPFVEIGTDDETFIGKYEAITEISDLPSAQPEIIRCNACRHWTQTTGEMRGFGLGNCDYHNAKLVNCNGFCYWAERRTDEID